ncbi:MAG: hypothetical protein ACYCVB_00665 [Bacilli bacterium]
MATQLQATPVLHGRDAKAVMEEMVKKPTKEQIKMALERKKKFEGIGKRGLR